MRSMMGIVEQRLLKECAAEPRNTPALLSALGYRTRTGNFRSALSRLVDAGLLEMTIPHVPRSKNQRYRITATGRDLLEAAKKASKP